MTNDSAFSNTLPLMNARGGRPLSFESDRTRRSQILSDDWTKTLHLQADRTVELHTQGGFYYRTRIPRFGRALAYHFPTCDALFGASGNEVYRLNLEQGRYLSPLVLGSGGGATDAGTGDASTVAGVNAIDINPTHGLWAFGIDGNGTVEFWDPRSRSSLGVLALPRSRLIPLGTSGRTVLPGVDGDDRPRLSVTALASRTDGLSYAVGTSTGHTLLYDIRSRRPFALKDQGYGLPVKRVSWIEGGAKMAGDGLVVSADKKVIKIWDRNSVRSAVFVLWQVHELYAPAIRKFHVVDPGNRPE